MSIPAWAASLVLSALARLVSVLEREGLEVGGVTAYGLARRCARPISHPSPTIELGRPSVVHRQVRWIVCPVRALPPCEVAVVARDLESITDQEVDAALDQLWELSYADDSARAYVMHYLGVARDFASTAAAEGRGFAYLIG